MFTIKFFVFFFAFKSRRKEDALCMLVYVNIREHYVFQFVNPFHANIHLFVCASMHQYIYLFVLQKD